MELAYLKTLLEMVDTGSFSKAADNLYVTQSAVSRRIKFMEDQYGYPLLDRSGPNLLLTDAGTVVADQLAAGLLVPHYLDGFQHQRCRKLVCAGCYQQSDLAEKFVTAVREICEEHQKAKH